VYTPLQDSGPVGRSPWDWTATGPVEVGRDVTREELMDIRALEEGVLVPVVLADDEVDWVIRRGPAAPEYPEPPAYGSR